LVAKDSSASDSTAAAARADRSFREIISASFADLVVLGVVLLLFVRLFALQHCIPIFTTSTTERRASIMEFVCSFASRLPATSQFQVRIIHTPRTAWRAKQQARSFRTTAIFHREAPGGAPEKARGQSKLYASADEAVADIKSGSIVLSSGFGLCGTAETLIAAMARRGVDSLHSLTA
jgi:hypothetical protein